MGLDRAGVVMSGLGQLVTSGPLILALPVAAAAGAVTFLSPCCLPLVPGYLSFVTGMAGASGAQPNGTASLTAGPASPTGEGGARVAVAAPPVAAPPVATAVPGPPRGSKGRMVAGTALFVLGFSVVFVAYGAALGGLGHLLTGHARLLTRVLGALTILLGLLFAGVFDRFSFAGRIVRPSARPKAGLAGAPLLGVMFGLGWTPCIGPTLTAVLALSASTGTAARGAVLAFVYALGLGIPFLLVALGFQVAMRASAFARRHARLVTRIGGAMLVCVGLLEVTGTWSAFMAWLQVHWASSYQSPI
ncbi:MAG TPA: cytochrome c biogenesis protein CcdA [Streptosporangiaceae bacterium]|jgi:cytochrome c-type biogenesis protein|nr:cytochrome c biogenesis protein CcdA [Streptosporangiaceae bacterium]